MHTHTLRRFERVIADAGYESIENYLYLEEHGQDCFIKPQNHEKSKTRKHKANKYIVDNLLYDKENDELTCARGDKLTSCGTGKKVTANGYETELCYYKNCSCEGCEHYGKCHSSKNGYRTLKVTIGFTEYRQKAENNIMSTEGILLRQNRSIQVEGAFGVLKQDMDSDSFLFAVKKTLKFNFSFLLLLLIFKNCITVKNQAVLEPIFLSPKLLD